MKTPFTTTQPQWLPSQLEILKADERAWKQWEQQNAHYRLTQVLPRPRPPSPSYMPLAERIVWGALFACLGALAVLWTK